MRLNRLFILSTFIVTACGSVPVKTPETPYGPILPTHTQTFTPEATLSPEQLTSVYETATPVAATKESAVQTAQVGTLNRVPNELLHSVVEINTRSSSCSGRISNEIPITVTWKDLLALDSNPNWKIFLVKTSAHCVIEDGNRVMNPFDIIGLNSMLDISEISQGTKLKPTWGIFLGSEVYGNQNNPDDDHVIISVLVPPNQYTTIGKDSIPTSAYDAASHTSCFTVGFPFNGDYNSEIAMPAEADVSGIRIYEKDNTILEGVTTIANDGGSGSSMFCSSPNGLKDVGTVQQKDITDPYWMGFAPISYEDEQQIATMEANLIKSAQEIVSQ